MMALFYSTFEHPPFFWHIKLETEKRLPRYLVRACNANTMDGGHEYVRVGVSLSDKEQTKRVNEGMRKTRVRYICAILYLNVSFAAMRWGPTH